MAEFIKFEKEVPLYLTLDQDEPDLKQGTYGKFYVWKCVEGDLKATIPLAQKMKDLKVGKGDKIKIEKLPQTEHPERTYFAVERYEDQSSSEVEPGVDSDLEGSYEDKFKALKSDLTQLFKKHDVPY